MGYGFTMLDDGNPNDNKISLVMSIITKNSIAGQTFHFKFNHLEAIDQLPGVFETIPGPWETTIKLDFKDYSNLYQIDKNITLFGYKAVLKTISVSPISISFKIEISSTEEIHKSASSLKEFGEYPITINYKDGTSETTKITGFNSVDM
ncbi:hypothetical protein P615_18185 [Brevibacillus laterosporus PE36]|nr:hypothetical protein P615_18185 [Brevibacillus laterosporus PE36]